MSTSDTQDVDVAVVGGGAAGLSAAVALARSLRSVVVLDAPPHVKAAVNVWGPVAGLDLMRAVKSRFDPQRRLAPGRFVGGI